MDSLLREYLPILIFLGIAVGLTLVIVAASLIAGPHRPDSEKLSPYECGFEAFDDARRRFDVRFYLVSLLFIIFDLEVAFLFPWAISLADVGVFGCVVEPAVGHCLPHVQFRLDVRGAQGAVHAHRVGEEQVAGTRLQQRGRKLAHVAEQR